MGPCIPTSPVVNRQRQRHAKFKTNLSDTVRPHEKEREIEKEESRGGREGEREAFLSTLRGRSKRLWSQASSAWPY